MKFNPHNHQSYCIDRIISDKAVGLLLDMGLGKNVITLTAINDLKYNRFSVNCALIIAPKKVAEATWTSEAEKWDHLKFKAPQLPARIKKPDRFMEIIKIYLPEENENE